MTFCVVIESLAGMVSNYGWCCYRPILFPVMTPAGVVIKFADILDVRILNRAGKVSDWIASISRLDVIQKQAQTMQRLKKKHTNIEHEENIII